MKKMSLALIAIIPFIAGCRPFSKEQTKQEVTTETMAPAAEEVTTSSEEGMTEEATHEEAESDEK